MIHLAIDTVGAKFGGAATVASDVVRSALAQDRVTRLTVFGSRAGSRRFQWPSDPRLRVVEPGYPDEGLLGRTFWPLYGLSRAAKRAGATHLLCLSNAGIGASGLPTTVFIQQPLPFSWEALSRFRTHEQVYVQAAQQVTHLSALRARAVAVQTPTMQRWVMRDFALPERRVVVVPPDPGAALALSPKPRAGRRILYVGSTSAHKNVDCLGQAKRILEQRYPDLQVAVSLPKEHALVQRYAFEPLGYMSQEQLSLEYERATVLVLPAFVETVGLPLLEAMRHGCPVVVADRPYAFDVCGDAALRFDPNVPVNLARTLEQIWQEPAATAERVQMGLQRIRAQHARGGYAQLIELAIRA